MYSDSKVITGLFLYSIGKLSHIHVYGSVSEKMKSGYIYKTL